MSADATSSPERKMDCGRVAREEIVETYVAGTLSEEEREAFEEHYFECARCLDDLQTLQAIRAELNRRRTDVEPGPVRPLHRWVPAVGLAAATLLAAAVWLWWAKPGASSGVPSTTSVLEAQLPRPSGSRETPQQPGSAPSLQQLARVDPPSYEPLRLRGTADESTERFRRGMDHYRKADYPRAIEALRAAADLDPDAPHVHFFLGVSYLLAGRDGAAIEQLRATVALGNSAYLEEAHWYLAKTFLRRKDPAAAERELTRLIELRGARHDEAIHLLTELQRIARQPR